MRPVVTAGRLLSRGKERGCGRTLGSSLQAGLASGWPGLSWVLGETWEQVRGAK